MGEETLWYARRAGEFERPGPHMAHVHDSPQAAAETNHDPSSMVLVTDLTVPDRCCVPDDAPMDAGQVLRVVGSFWAPCRHPSCAEDLHEVRVFVAERGWYIGECPRTGFSWMRV